MSRRQFTIEKISVNGQDIRIVIVDDHVQEAHPDITDDVILDLVRKLDGTEQEPDDEKPPYRYFASLLTLKGKQYRLVWLLEEGQLYIGVVTVYRDTRKK